MLIVWSSATFSNEDCRYPKTTNVSIKLNHILTILKKVNPSIPLRGTPNYRSFESENVGFPRAQPRRCTGALAHTMRSALAFQAARSHSKQRARNDVAQIVTCITRYIKRQGDGIGINFLS